jgi:hypothetical protein
MWMIRNNMDEEHHDPIRSNKETNTRRLEIA